MTNAQQCIKEMFAEVSRQHQYMSIPFETWRMSVAGVALFSSTGDISYTKSDALVSGCIKYISICKQTDGSISGLSLQCIVFNLHGNVSFLS